MYTKKLINTIDTKSELNIIQINMDIEELKKELGITNADIAKFFELTPMAYANSSAKKRYEQAICRFYAFVKSKREGETKETDLTDAVD